MGSSDRARRREEAKPAARPQDRPATAPGTAARHAPEAAGVRRAVSGAGSPTAGEVLRLQRVIGNRGVGRLLAGRAHAVQRAVQGWAEHRVASGTTVYHVTAPNHAQSIIENGVQAVQNAFGGGRLGSGFYTHTNQQSAALYSQEPTPVTLEFTLSREVVGQIAPQDVYVGTTNGLDYLAGNDFVTAAEDTNELKFHDGAYLQLVAVHQGGTRFTLQEWREFM